MQIASQFCKLGPCTLFLSLLLFLSDLAIVIIEVASDFLIFGLDVLQVLLASVEVVLPSAAVVTAIAINTQVVNDYVLRKTVSDLNERFCLSAVPLRASDN